MVENRKKHRQNSQLIILFPTSEGVSEVSGASERANGRASGPVFQSVFLAFFDHSEVIQPSRELALSAGIWESVCTQSCHSVRIIESICVFVRQKAITESNIRDSWSVL